MATSRCATSPRRLGGELIGDPALRIASIEPLESAGAGDASPSSPIRATRSSCAHRSAGCVIVAPALRDAALARGAAIVTPDPYLYFARLTQWWAARSAAAAPRGIHPSAVVDPARASAPTSSIGAVRRRRGAAPRSATARSIGAHASSAPAASIGAGTRLGRASASCSATTHRRARHRALRAR